MGNDMDVGVAVVGGGQGCLELLQLFDHFRLEEFRGRILGVADVNPRAPGIAYARKKGLITTTDFTEFYSCPDIEVMIELTGDNRLLEQIYRTKPTYLKVIDHVGARLFWDLMKLKADKRARDILESTRDAFVLVNRVGRIMQYNKAAVQMFGDSGQYLAGKNIWELGREIFGLEGVKTLAKGDQKVCNLIAFQGAKQEFPAEVCFFPVEIDEEDCLVLSIRDVSERWRAQQEISRLHRYEMLCNSVAAEFALSSDVEATIRNALQMIGENFGAERVSLWYISPRSQRLILKGEWYPAGRKPRNYRDLVMAQKFPFLWENVKAGDIIKVYNSDVLPEPDRTNLAGVGVRTLVGLPVIGKGTPWGVLLLENSETRLWSDAEVESLATIVNIMQNSIQREEAQYALRESEALYQEMVDKSLTGIYIIQNGSFFFVNRRMAEMFGYTTEEMSRQEPLNLVHPEDREMVTEKICQRLDGSVPSVHYTFRGVRKDGAEVWLECMGTRVIIRGRPAIIGNMVDVTERVQNERIRIMMFEAITMLAVGMVEQRDPYTAGHQRRVAEIAVAIGRQMGLSESRLEGLRLAGLIHDIGKFAVPIEILTKPGKLRPSEFEFIRLHSQVGAELLAEVPFPWDIASIITQHHERLDGSGYPAGLRGDEIYLEARILAVADVLEAMSSHRPYRASLGIKAAMQELTENRGRLYDPRVIEALQAIVDQLDLG